MPTFYMQNDEGYVRNDLDHYVQVTLGDDPIVICCTAEQAKKLVDARTIAAKVGPGMPRAVEYNANFTLFLHRLTELWPMRKPPTWQQLCNILNEAGMLTPNGTNWMRHNLMQKMGALGWDIQSIVNPRGEDGDFEQPRPTEHPAIAKVKEALEQSRGGISYAQVGPTSKADDELFGDENPF